MEKASFTNWLQEELASAKQALLASYVQRDQLLYQEGPALLAQYLEQFGALEETVLQSELTTRLLERKIDLIQIAMNQQKPIDVEAIEQQLQTEKQDMLQSLQASANPATPTRICSEQEQQELQRKYRAIVHDYHPQVHTGLSKTQKELYEKALEAYKTQNVEALNLVYELLYDSAEIQLNFVINEANSPSFGEVTADYTLTAQVYEAFVQSSADTLLHQATQHTTQQRNEVSDDITQIQSRFPFIARETLRNPEKAKAYLAELNTRHVVSEEAQKAYTEKIKNMLKEYDHGK